MLKKIILLGALISANCALALPDPLLVLDARNADKLPKKFRVDTESHAAGSAQFSELGLVKALERIQGRKVTIIDLRQESHGFLNGNAVSWYAKHNAINTDFKSGEISRRENKLLASLAKNKFATIYNIINKSEDGVISSATPQDFAVHSVSSEEELVSKHHLKYQRIYVQDFHAPDDKSVDQFIKLVKKLPQDQWLYFHCRGGSGRTTSFMVMYEMLRQAKNIAFEEIIAHQLKLGGKDLTVLPEEGSDKYPAAAKRLAFLKKFYEYVKDSDENFTSDWSVWVKNHS